MDDFTFKNCVLEEFDFLVNEYGFRCTQSRTYYLRFESNSVFLELHYDGQRSFEMDFSLGLLDDLYEGRERPFFLGELIKFSGTDENENYHLMQASSPEKVAILVPKLASLVKIYAEGFFSGDKVRFKALSDFREKECNQHDLEKTLKNVRAAVQLAWRNKDYARVIKLYEPFRKHINPSELKKLEYCYDRRRN